MKLVEWMTDDNAAALAEGWAIFNGNEIQRDDEVGTFDTDADALNHVKARAAEGSALHRKALAICT